ncbi:MAG TPA: tetratricopeptide repeat protein [Casimicrobiaceae bacterium]|nr:tetratricopeptide repeat protein [Casimicrobiaceae bacterium]
MAPPAVVSRTARCPCGSGKRFKACHGALALIAQDADRGLRLQDARTAFAAGRIEQAQGTVRHLLESDPQDVVAWNLLGDCLEQSDKAAAREAWWHALELDPGNARASFQLANHCLEHGQYRAAAIHYERALHRVPRYSAALNNLGLCYKSLGDHARAAECYRAVLAADPDHPDAAFNLANLLFQQTDYAGVVAATEGSLAQHGGRPPLALLRALAQERLGDVGSAESTLLEATRKWPDDATLHTYLGAIYVHTRRYAESEAPLERGLAIAPRSVYALSMLAQAQQHRCAWSGLTGLFSQLEAILADEGSDSPALMEPFPALSMSLSPLAQLRIARRWARQFAPGRRTAPPRVVPGSDKRLRVGLVSRKFRDHGTAGLWVEVFGRIDRSRVETFAYRLGGRDESASVGRIQPNFEHFVDMSAQPVQQIAERIERDRIAILIDHDGYTTNARDNVFALRPAPIQVNGPGFPGTLGSEHYDYILTDRFSLPEGLQRFYSERPLYMPYTAIPGDPISLPHDPSRERSAHGLPEEAFVFCCFNDNHKILPDVFAVWMRLLAAVPGGMLWLLEAGTEAEGNLRGEASAAGIDPARLVFGSRLPFALHVARHAAADLFLDTYPYGATASANDALLVGLPLVTLAGRTLASRIAGSQLGAAGLPELVTGSLSEYEALASRLATEPATLKLYRDRLIAARFSSPLFDLARYARDFEHVIRIAWQDYVAGRPN